jgi:hypothetical protein
VRGSFIHQGTNRSGWSEECGGVGFCATPNALGVATKEGNEDVADEPMEKQIVKKGQLIGGERRTAGFLGYVGTKRVE